MEKTATLNLRVNPTLKTEAEEILNRLGIPMSTAVDMFLNQIVLVGGIPFPITLPKPPASIDLSQMTEEQLREKLERSIEQAKNGECMEAKEAFRMFKEQYFK